MMRMFQAFWSDESGQGLVEYALMIALVAVGLIAILLVLRNISATCSTTPPRRCRTPPPTLTRNTYKVDPRSQRGSLGSTGSGAADRVVSLAHDTEIARRREISL